MFNLLSNHPRSFNILTGVATALFSPLLAAAPFTVYDHMLYSGRPDMQALGMPRMEFTGGDKFFTADHSKDTAGRCDGPDTAAAAASQDASSDYAVIDMEEACWKLSKATGDADFNRRMSFWQEVIDAYKVHAPNTKFGFYSEPPRNFLAIQQGTNSAAYKRWEADVERQAALFQGEKTIFPSLYLFSNDVAMNKRYIDSMIDKAVAVAGPGKRVIPLMWPKYHQASPAAIAGNAVDGAVWRAELEDIRAAGADGVIIWTQPDPWAPQADSAWWAETKKFMATLDDPMPANDSPGTLQFSASNYSVTEGAKATITVIRSGGSTGAVSVDYTTVDGTAIDGADYPFITGSLKFAAGAVASKTFEVPTMDDTDFEDTETLTVSLSNPDGGATLGYRRTAVLSINDKSAVTDETCAGQAVTIAGTPENDTIYGTNDPDVIAGLGGNDDIRSKDGADIVCGGDGNDKLYGGFGNDQLYGGPGDDLLDGRYDTDQCDGGAHIRGDRAINCEQVTNVP